MRKVQCYQCNHWSVLDNDNTRGRCRCHAPAVFMFVVDDDRDGLSYPMRTAWPLTLWNEWCGESSRKVERHEATASSSAGAATT